MAKLLLLSPPVSLEKRYGKLAAAGNTMPSLGLLHLAAVSRLAGHSVHLIDASASAISEETVNEHIRKIQPDMLGITSTTLGISDAASVARKAKTVLPNLLTVLGGPHVSAVPEETLQRFPEFDVACIGEGEDTIAELLSIVDGSEIRAGKHGIRRFHERLHSVPGILFRKEMIFQKNNPRPPIMDLDKLPMPAWDLLPGFPWQFQPAANRTRLLPAASLVSTRGCPNQCTFCDRSVFGSHCRGFSAGYFMEMVSQLQNRWGVRELVMEDDTFFVLKRRFLEICDSLVKLPKRISWSCLGRVQSVTPEILQTMKKAGCWQIAYGIESGSQEILDFAKKRQSLEEVEQAVRWTKEAGILAKGFFILGHPKETTATLQATHDFALRLKLDDISVFFMTPFPGSRLYEEAHQYGEFDGNWQKMNLLNSVFIPKGLTKEDLETSMRQMLRRFYMRPRIIWSLAHRCMGNRRFAMQFLKGAFGFLRFLKSR